MKSLTSLAPFASLVLLSSTSLPAANITWVTFHDTGAPSQPASDAGFSEAPDIGYTDLLTANGHTVTRYLTRDDPTATDLAVFNAADVVVISRSIGSGQFQEESAFWNTEVTVPVMMMSGYILRSNRLTFSGGTNMADTTGPTTLVANVPAHPVFDGVSLDGTNTMVNPFSDLATGGGAVQRGASINTDSPVGGTVIASITADGSPANGPVIAEWPVGATLGNNDVILAPRLAFVSGSREVSGVNSETAGVFDLSADGAQMFLNAVDYLAGLDSGTVPKIANVNPLPGTDYHDPAEGVTFVVTSSAGVANDDVGLTLNGDDVSAQLAFDGTPTELAVTYPGLQANLVYSGQITVATGTGDIIFPLNFNTFDPDAFGIEGEDFNFDGGEFIDGPVLSFLGDNSYVDKGSAQGVPGVDYLENDPDDRGDPNILEYRFSSDVSGLPQTPESNDTPREKYTAASFPEYELGSVTQGEWLNYSRTYPSGNFNVIARIRRADAESFVVRLDEVTSDPTVAGQSTAGRGFFLGDGAGEEYGFVFLTDVTGSPVTVGLDGLATLRLSAVEGNCDVNYFFFAPAGAAVELPAVSITAPVDGVAITPGANLPITVDVGGGIASVAYRAVDRDGVTTEVGQSTEAPFGITWSAVPEGTYSLIARATSTGGLVNDSVGVRVFADVTPPQVESVRGRPSKTETTVTFDEPVDPLTAGDPANYTIATGGGGALEVTGASVSPDGLRVTLVTGEQTIGDVYMLTVTGVTDQAGNAVADGTTGEFRGVGAILQGEDGFVVFEAEDFDRNPDGLWLQDLSRGNPSGGVSMVVPNGEGGGEGNTILEYDIQFTQTGTHYVWWRASAVDGVDDSAWLWLDGGRPPNRATGNEASMTGFSEQPDFVWRNLPQDGAGTMTLEIESAGLHTIGITQREDGAFFDKLVVSTNPDFDPLSFGAFGPPSTRREGEPEGEIGGVTITMNPQDTTGLERTSVTISAEFDVEEGVLFTPRWERKNVGETEFSEITGGGGGASLTINPLTMDWNGAEVRLTILVTGGSVVSEPATVSVTPETEAPTITLATGLATRDRVTVFYSEAVDPTSAGEPANYTIVPVGGGDPVAVTSATLLPNGSTALLETGTQVVGTKYEITASGIADLAFTPNVATATAKFFSLGELLPQSDEGLLVFEAENFDGNDDGLWVEDFERSTPAGGIAMVVPNGEGGNGSEDTTRLTYDLTFTQTGSQIVWYRVSGDGGGDDSAWLHIDGSRPVERADGTLASMSGFQGTPDYVWRSNPQTGGGQMTFDLATAGVHEFGLSLREDGAFFDKFLITTDPSLNPNDFGPFGPPETREGAPPLPGVAIVSPADGESFGAGPVEIEVAIQADGRVVSRVEFYNGDEKIGESTAAPFGFTWTDVPSGSYDLRAVLTDDVGDGASSSVVAVDVGLATGPQIFVDILRGDDEVTLIWAGGIAPYTVQTNTTADVLPGSWVDALVTDQLTATFPIVERRTLFRISGTIPPGG